MPPNSFLLANLYVSSFGKPTSPVDRFEQLSYTRGSVIPCFLTLQCSDAKALRLFSAPTAVSLCLQRRVRFYSKPSHSRSEVAWHETCGDMGSAVWWPAAEASGNPNIRRLEGEIKLAKDLRPSTCIGHFSVSVSVLSCRIRKVTDVAKSTKLPSARSMSPDSSRMVEFCYQNQSKL